MKALLIELFDKYYKDVYTYLYGLSHDASLSEDLTQEVFLEVIKSIASFRGDSDIKTWLFSIARHRWYAYLRGKSRQIDADSIHDLHDANFINLSMDPFPSQLEEAIQVVVSEEPGLTKQVFKMRLDGY
ncbi:MAG: RNA polymerase sigma factor, partial [Firmicutes bacterium]|nr:RNA polymerase sigma factor [Bacillota bacterium]